MFLLNQPYVSPLLKDTIKKNKYAVLKNDFTLDFDDYDFLFSDEDAVKQIKCHNEKIYSNSEDSIEWIIKNLSFSDIPEKIELFKNKVKFRNLLKQLYPDFYYKEVLLSDLKNLDKTSLKYPFVLKPAVGFLSFGVYPVRNEIEFENVIKNIDKDIEKLKGFFPIEVVDTSKFIIEEMINGDEFAIDVYYNNKGEAVILNIFKHPFLNEKDVSDRLYYTSKEIIQTYIPKFQPLLDKIGVAANLKNFPIHIEIRVENEKIIPIEVNPMRFAGWCDTDLAYFAYGINIYEYYMENKKPDWDEILKNKGDELYYFTAAEMPSSIDKNKVKNFNYDDYLSYIKNPLEIRKFDFKTKPLFAFVFGKTSDFKEINDILALDMKKFIEI